LAEGRKSFLERYAGIESGRECERLAPMLSAFVDGEADGAQTLALRMHLRQCLACRAAVRGLHDASRPLTVVFPAVGLAVASGGVEQTHSLFVRVYETVSLHLHERTANSLVRAQAIVDTVTAGKMAAAAASAAALAGGGVAVEGVLSAAPPATPQAIVRRADNGAATAFVKDPVPRTKARAHVKQRSHARTSKTSGAGGSRRASSGSRGSTGSGNAAAASRVSSAPAASTPRVTAASTGATRGAGTSATSEFGFEGP
jgi:hypothetical protein